MRQISQDSNRNEFKYQNLPIQQRTSIQQLTLEIREKACTTIRTSWEIGKKLVEARHQLEPDQFSSWLKIEFDWSRRTAYNFIHVYEAFPEFASANFARLNISISALYLLAAPSLQPAIRHDFLRRALAGERISHKVIQTAIRSIKAAPANNREEVGSVIPDGTDVSRSNRQIEPQPSQTKDPTSSTNSALTALQLLTAEEMTTITSDLYPAWNRIDPEFSLFWGDTTSPRFIERLPADAFVLAVPYCKWHHNWLANESRSCIIIAQPKLEQELVERLLLAFASGENALIFPWIPSWKMIGLALNLNIKVYAGDPELDRCEQTISKLGLSGSKIERIRW